MKTLVLACKKIEREDQTKYDAFYSQSKTETIISESDINDGFKLIYTIIISNIKKHLEKSSRWIIASVIDHTISISKYNPFAISNHIELTNKIKPYKKRID